MPNLQPQPLSGSMMIFLTIFPNIWKGGRGREYISVNIAKLNMLNSLIELKKNSVIIFILCSLVSAPQFAHSENAFWELWSCTCMANLLKVGKEMAL